MIWFLSNFISKRALRKIETRKEECKERRQKGRQRGTGTLQLLPTEILDQCGIRTPQIKINVVLLFKQLSNNVGKEKERCVAVNRSTMYKRDLAVLFISVFAIYLSVSHEGQFDFVKAW